MGTSDGIPHYYAEFDPSIDTTSMINPCTVLPRDYLRSFNLVEKPDLYRESADQRLITCNFSVLDQFGRVTNESSAYIIGRDDFSPHIIRSNYEVFYEENGWIVSDGMIGGSNSMCTASISTSRGRFFVIRTLLNPDPEVQLQLCDEAHHMARILGDYMFTNEK